MHVWAVPLALGGASAAGLVAALIDDGLGDLISWIALGAPAAAAVRFWLLPARTR